MSFRNLDDYHDWQFGNGRNDYVSELQEIKLNLETRILSFLGDCFFAINEGIDWFNLLDYRYQNRLELAAQNIIKNTPGIIAINNIQILLGANRKITLQYEVETIYPSNIEDNISIPIIN